MQFSLLVFLVSAAAAVPAADKPTTTLSGEGGACMQAVFPRPVCDPSKDLICRPPAKMMPGARGTCVKIARAGQACDAHGVLNPARCAPNLRCDHSGASGPMGAAGKCVEVFQDVGEPCDHGLRDGRNCGEGLKCSSNGRAGGSGTCEIMGF